jgi:hypothetical protein
LRVPFALKSPTIAFIATWGFCVSSGVSADASRPIDYTDRNQPYAPAESIASEKQKPVKNGAVQDKRVDKPTLEKQNSSLREREAPMEVKEMRPKEVREKKSHRPEVIEHSTSHYNQRLSSISTASDTSKPPTVAKYQDSLTAASATNMARFPAVDRATTAKINRFVFRKNPPESPAGVKTGAAIRAGGGSVLQK